MTAKEVTRCLLKRVCMNVRNAENMSWAYSYSCPYCPPEKNQNQPTKSRNKQQIKKVQLPFGTAPLGHSLICSEHLVECMWSMYLQLNVVMLWSQGTCLSVMMLIFWNTILPEIHIGATLQYISEDLTVLPGPVFGYL